MTMTCSEARRLLHARLDGELPEKGRERLDGHLAACAPCRAAGEELRALAGALEALPAEPAPEGAVERLLARAAAGEASAAHRRPLILRPALGALLAAASLLLGLFLGERMGRPAPQPAAPPAILLAAASATDLLPAGSPVSDLLDALPREGGRR